MENQENGVLEAKYKRRRDGRAQQMMLKASKVKTGALTSEVSKCAFMGDVNKNFSGEGRCELGWRSLKTGNKNRER